MISEELNTILDELNRSGRHICRKAASADDIRSFEETHHIRFSGQLRQWLTAADGAELFLPAGIQLYGVAHDPKIDTADFSCPSRNFIRIGTASWGDPILYQQYTEKVCIYNREAERIESDEIYPDFFSFLQNLADLLGVKN